MYPASGSFPLCHPHIHGKLCPPFYLNDLFVSFPPLTPDINTFVFALCVLKDMAIWPDNSGHSEACSTAWQTAWCAADLALPASVHVLINKKPVVNCKARMGDILELICIIACRWFLCCYRAFGNVSAVACEFL